MIVSSASKSFRIRLAKYMVGAETPPTLYDQLWACLKEPKPANLAAQIVLYQNGRSDRKIQESLDASFLAQSSGVMCRLLGLPAPKQGEAASTRRTPVANPYPLAEQFWSRELAAAVQQRLRAVESLHDDGSCWPWLPRCPLPPCEQPCCIRCNGIGTKVPKGSHRAGPPRA